MPWGVVSLVCAIATSAACADERLRYDGKTAPQWAKAAVSSSEQRLLALYNVQQFGPGALAVVPELWKLLGTPSDSSATDEDDVELPRTSKDRHEVREAIVAVLAGIGPDVVPSLLDAARQANPSRREAALATLGLIRPPQRQHLNAVRLALKDAEERVRFQAALAVQRLEGQPESALPVLTDLLQANDGELRRAAARELARLGPRAAAAVPALIAALSDLTFEVTPLPTRTISTIHGPFSLITAALVAIGPDAAPALRLAVRDRRKHVRAQALLALACLPVRDAEVIPVLRAALQDTAHEVRLVAAMHLWRRSRDATAVVPVLLDILRNGERALARPAGFVLAWIGRPARAALPVLFERLRDPRRSTEAKYILGEFGVVAVPELMEMLDDRMPVQLRQDIVSLLHLALRSTDDEEAVTALVRGLKAERMIQRLAAATALSQWSPHGPRIVPALRPAMRDDNPLMRLYAFRGLSMFDPLGSSDEAAVGLATFLGLKDAPERAEAARTLSYMRSRARQALPSLRELVKDKDPLVRSYLLGLLSGLEPDNAEVVADRLKQIEKGEQGQFNGPPLPVSALPRLATIQQSSRRSQRSVIWAVRSMKEKPPAAVALLVEGLKADSSSDAFEAAEGLVPFAGDERVRTALLALENRLDKNALLDVPFHLSLFLRLGVDGLPVLRRSLRDPLLRDAVLDRLAFGKPHESERALLPDVRRCLDEKDHLVRCRAVRAALRLGEKVERLAPVVREILNADELLARRKVMAALGNHARLPEVVPLLIAGLENRDRDTPPVLSNGFFQSFEEDCDQNGFRGTSGGRIRIGLDLSLFGGISGPLVRSIRSGGLFGDQHVYPSATQGEAARALLKAGPAARAAEPHLLALLRGSSPVERGVAATLLGEIGAAEKSTIEVLKKALRDEEPAVRAAAAGALSRLDRAAVEAIPVLVGALADEVRVGVPGPHIEALVRFGRSAVPALVELLQAGERGRQLSEPWGITPGVSDAVLAGQAAWALAEMGTEATEALPALLAALRPQTAENRMRENRTDFSFGTQMIHQPSFRQSAIRALGNLKARAATATLRRIAFGLAESREVRLAAVEALWRIDRDAKFVVAAVSEILVVWDSLEDLTWLAELGPAAADFVPLIALRLNEPGWEPARREWTHRPAVQLLGHFGPAARHAVPKLKELLRKGVPDLEDDIMAALKRIE